MSRFYKVTKRIYSNELKVTEHPDGDWVKREEYEQLKQELEAYKKSIRTITYMDGEEVFNDYHEFVDLSKKVEPVVYEYLVSQEQEK